MGERGGMGRQHEMGWSGQASFELPVIHLFIHRHPPTHPSLMCQALLDSWDTSVNKIPCLLGEYVLEERERS